MLVLDDDASVLELLSCFLEREGYVVIRAGDGVEGLDNLEAFGANIDVMVLDVDMPRMDGVSFWHEARRRGHRIPAILVSARADVHEIARELGVQASLVKPFKHEELTARVKDLRALPGR